MDILADLIRGITIWALPVVFAITLHEAAHGYVARYFGDSTAYMLGRVSLNPLRHIDPVGTIAVPLTLFVLSKFTGGAGILFGWAKPVPVNFAQLRNPKRDMLWVAAAGPGVNLLMAIGWGFLLKLGAMNTDSYFAEPLILMSVAGVFVNLMLMALNLLPFPPLDGGRIAVSLLPHKLAYRYAQIEPYGFMILILLLATGVLGQILWPMIQLAVSFIAFLIGAPPRDLIQLLNSV